MKRAFIASAVVAAMCTATVVLVALYLFVGVIFHLNVSSLDDSGPQWPFTVFSFASLGALVSGGVAIVLGFDRQTLRRGRTS